MYSITYSCISFRVEASNIRPLGRILPAKAFNVIPEGILNKLKLRDIFFRLNLLTCKSLFPPVFWHCLACQIETIRCVIYTQWCRSKPIARGALLITRGTLFLHASLQETLILNPRIYINK